MGGTLYLGVKFAAYALWCWLGLRLFQSARASRAAMAIALGLLRSAMGLGFGVAIWLIGSLVYTALSHVPATSALTYLLVYVPIRWLEWSLIVLLICPPCRSLKGFFLGRAKADRLWRLGGIFISCLSDIPMIISLAEFYRSGGSCVDAEAGDNRLSTRFAQLFRQFVHRLHFDRNWIDLNREQGMAIWAVVSQAMQAFARRHVHIHMSARNTSNHLFATGTFGHAGQCLATREKKQGQGWP